MESPVDLETDRYGCIADADEDDIREIFEAGSCPGNFVKLARALDDYLYIELRAQEDEPVDWGGDLCGVYYCDPEAGRLELEEGVKLDVQEDLLVLFLCYFRGEPIWRWKWRGEC
jgi:hypothetical protein